MREINIAKILVSKRKEKGITQDDIARFIGVSKASVSKWETGQSYPDITFLPRLASYFNISIDELIGYEPQMSNDDIRKLYKELSAEFSEKPFDEVKTRCHEIVKEYYSCYPLLFQIGVLFLNYGLTSKIEQQKISTLLKAKELFIRVKEQTDEIGLEQFALHMEAAVEIMLGNPAGTIGLLKNVKYPPLTSMNYSMPTAEELLSQAYIMTGKLIEAKTIFQENIFSRVTGLLSIVLPFLGICAGDVKYFEELCKRTTDVIKTFDLTKICPAVILPFYLGASHGYLEQGNPEKALDMLETYADVAVGIVFPLELIKTDGFFNLIDTAKEAPYGIADLPRDEKAIKRSMVEAVTENPVYSSLAEETRFKKLTENLKKII